MTLKTNKLLLAGALLVLAAFWLHGCATVSKVIEDVNKLCADVPGSVPVFDPNGGLRCVVPSPLPSPVPSPTATPSPSPTPTPTPQPTPGPTPSPSATPKPIPTPTVPPIAPTPTPTCIPERMPEGAADVRSGLKPSTCTAPDPSGRCVRGEPSGETVPWSPADAPDPDNWCRPLQNFGGRVDKTLGGITLRCEPGYLTDPDDTARGCHDAYGRRYQWDGGRWVEQALVDRGRDFSGWWFMVCPARLKTCEAPPSPTPTPGGTCSLPAMPECGGRQADSDKTHVWGCCISSDHPQFGHRSPYDDVLESVQDAIEQERAVRFDRDGRVDEDEYMTEVVRRLTALGLCVKRSVNPSEEIGIKGSNSENYQYDLVLSNGRPRHRGYTAYCKPARF